MKILTPVIFLFLVLVSAAFAGEMDENMTSVMSGAGFAEQQVSRIQHLISVAEQKGLPENAITSKVYEGIAKGVAPERIVQATERVTSRYEYGYDLAERLADGKMAARLGNTVAAGIAAGLKRQDAERLVNNLHGRSRNMDRNELYSLAEEALLTARDMSRQGVSSEITTEVVGSAIEKGFNQADMRTMRYSFTRQGMHGNVESLAREYGRGIERGADAGSLSGHGAGGESGPGEMGGGDESGHGGSGGNGGSGGSGGGGNR